MGRIDDYEMIEKDIEESMRFAQECFAAEEVANDTSRDWSERIIATAEIIFSESEGSRCAARCQNAGE